MKKKLVVFLGLFLIFAAEFTFAQEKENKTDCNWFTDEKVWNLGMTGEALNYYDFDKYKLGGGVYGTLDMQELFVKAGIYYENKRLHEASKVAYGPTINGNLRPGIVVQDHFCWDFDYYCEYDLLLGSFIEYQPNNKFKLDCSVLFQQNFSFIFNLPATRGPIYNCCPAYNLDFFFYPLDWMSINLTLSSFSTHKYYLFLAPVTRLAFDFAANENLTLEVAAELQAVDFFTSSSNYNSLGFSVGANWRF